MADIAGAEKNGCKVFSSFSCGGGSSMGYKLAGYEVVGNVEIDPDMIGIYRANLHPKRSYLMDIRDFVLMDDVPDNLYHLDILDGSPPCSVFSMAGGREDGWGTEKVFREGQKKQRLDDLFHWYIKLAAKLQPKVVIAENVTGLLAGDAKGYVNEILSAFHDAGYVMQLFRLNAASMGVPQKRERVFFIGHRTDLQYKKLQLSFREPPVPFGFIRSDKGKAVNPSSVVAKMLSRRKPGDKDLADISNRARNKNAGFTNPIVSDNEVCPTVCAGGTMYRFTDAKLFSKQDFVNAQTFPQDYDFGKQDPQYVCGMSVPPVMMARIASEVYRQWLGDGHG